ncbi:MAG: DUF1178 family protein [Burkholderiales bacterium]|nr:DUF1178 family protein [Burkholderiales bacterium]
MIVFNLGCDAEHRFEGWFNSADDFDAQSSRGLLSCPVCGSGKVQKLLSAPRLNLLSSGAPVPESDATPAGSGATRQVAVIDPRQRALAELISRVIAETEDVGTGFAEEARRIHYREAPERAIRGVASESEAVALAEEGIEVARLPFGVIDKSQLN